jgi:hypothetical protein
LDFDVSVGSEQFVSDLGKHCAQSIIIGDGASTHVNEKLAYMNKENVQNGTNSDGYISVDHRKRNKERTGVTVPVDEKKEGKVPDGGKSVNGQRTY